MKLLSPGVVLLSLAALSVGGCQTAPSTDAPPAAAPPSAVASASASAPAPDHHLHGTEESAPPPKKGAPNGRLTVHAATTMKATLTELAPRFEEAFPGTKVVFDFGGSSTHAQHIVDGAPVDVFISDDPAATATVAKARKSRGKAAPIAMDPVVIAVTTANPAKIKSYADLSRPGLRVAMCADTARCGATAKRVLTAIKIPLQPTSVDPDAAAALGKVRAGAVDAALVYRTDVATAGTEFQFIDVDKALLIADEYSVVRVTTGRNTVASEAFTHFVTSSLAQRVFSVAGFSVP
jgi:molybdate transport system substrate-binding protein